MRSFLFGSLMTAVLSLMLFSFKVDENLKVFYKLKVIGINQPSDVSRVEERLKTYSEFELIRIYFKSKLIYVKADKKTDFDLIKQDFDKAGLKIESQEIITNPETIKNLPNE